MSINTNRKDKNIFNVTEQPKEFVQNTLDYEQYALIYSKNYEKIMEKTPSETDQDKDYWAGLVKISSDAIGSKSVYRKCRAYSGIKSHDVALGYRTQQTLSLNNKDNKEIRVERTNWFCYLWNQFDTAKKYGFRAAVYGIGFTIVFSLLSIILTMVFAC